MDKEKIISLFLRGGIAFSFIYAAVFAYLNPTNWIGYIPDFLTFGLDKLFFLKIHSVVDLILGLWLLWGKKLFYSSVVSAVIIFGIIIFNINSFDIVFRDVSIFLAAVALAVMSYENGR
ncbi:MAG: hypothetical protein AABY16_03980 [Nanoarchaeota archaeon]